MKKSRLLVSLFLGMALLVACSSAADLTPAPTTSPTATPEPAASTENATNAGDEGQDSAEIQPDRPWWDETVFYEIFVRSFYDSDGDGVGDINGVIEKLDYLNDGDPSTTDDLGVNGIWLMPIMESPSYHGYDVVNYYKVDEEYGSKEDFQRLMAEAEKRGIKIIVDLVINHTSVQHPWFEQARSSDSPFRDWYVWADSHPNTEGWHSTDDGAYYGIFWEGMPDLNFANPTVSKTVQGISRYWLEEMQVDGFRLDAIKHLIEVDGELENTAQTRAWFTDYNAFLKTINPDVLTVGEVWSSTLSSSSYVVEDGVDLTFDFDIALALLDSARGSRRNYQSAYELALKSYPDERFATFITNHDQNRVVTQLFNDPLRARTAATLLLTSPGVPFIYYGEEIGMTGRKPDELIRTPMQWSAETNAGFTTGTPWQPINEGWEDVNVDVLRADDTSIFNHYRQLIQLRQQSEALQNGEWIIVDSDNNKVAAHLRVTDDHAYLVLANVGREPVSDYSLSLDRSPLSQFWSAHEMLQPRTQPATIELTEDGGFSDYVPYEELAPLESYLILLREDS